MQIKRGFEDSKGDKRLGSSVSVFVSVSVSISVFVSPYLFFSYSFNNTENLKSTLSVHKKRFEEL